jgi:hypothetical protein
MRVGSRESIDGDAPTRGDGTPPTDASLRALVPEDEESYSRVRLGAKFMF